MTSNALPRANDNEQSTSDVNNLPNYCNYCKFLLVEELALETDYRQLHYGKCTVIGKFKQDDKGYNYLENVQINHMPSDCRLPESCLNILLHLCNKPDLQLKSSHYYEIVGEVILFNFIKPEENTANFLTSRGVVEQLQFYDNVKDQEKLLKYFNDTYKPAINVWYAQSIARASDLIARNLELRIMQEKLQK